MAIHVQLFVTVGRVTELLPAHQLPFPSLLLLIGSEVLITRLPPEADFHPVFAFCSVHHGDRSCDRLSGLCHGCSTDVPGLDPLVGRQGAGTPHPNGRDWMKKKKGPWWHLIWAFSICHFPTVLFWRRRDTGDCTSRN